MQNDNNIDNDGVFELVSATLRHVHIGAFDKVAPCGKAACDFVARRPHRICYIVARCDFVACDKAACDKVARLSTQALATKSHRAALSHAALSHGATLSKAPMWTRL